MYIPSFYWNYLLRGFIMDSLISFCSPRDKIIQFLDPVQFVPPTESAGTL